MQRTDRQTDVRTDGRTDIQLCYINIARQYIMMTRNKNVADRATDTVTIVRLSLKQCSVCSFHCVCKCAVETASQRVATQDIITKIERYSEN